MKTALRFQSPATPRQVGETARLKVVRGPDQGSLFVLIGLRASIGRGTEADVQLSDPKTSRKHAELTLGSDGRWTVIDLGSANGILVNDAAPSAPAAMRSGDFLSLGETTFEFGVSAIETTRMLMAPPREAAEHQQMLSARERERKRVLRLGKFGGGMPDAVRSPSTMGGGKKFSPITLVVLAAGAYFLLFEDSGNKPVVSQKPKTAATDAKNAVAKDAARDLAAFLPHDPAAEEKTPQDGPRTVEMFYRAGFREYTKGNYLRAKRQFETALQIDPSHVPSRSYLGKTEQSISEEIDAHLLKGKRKLDAGQLRDSRGHFEAVLRLLYRDKDHPHYKEAQEQLEKVHQALKGGGTG